MGLLESKSRKDEIPSTSSLDENFEIIEFLTEENIKSEKLDDVMNGHPKDFILESSILNGKNFYIDKYRTMLLVGDPLKLLFKESFDILLNMNEKLNYLPSVLTIAIQIVIRMCTKKWMHVKTYYYILVVAYKFSVQLEYDNSIFEETRNICSLFYELNYNRELLIEMEFIILQTLEFSIINDTIYLWLTVEERQLLIDNKELRIEYYKMIMDVDTYLTSSRDNANIFRCSHLQHFSTIK